MKNVVRIAKLPQIVYISSGEGVDMADLSDSDKLIFDQLKQINERLTAIDAKNVHREELNTLKIDLYKKLDKLEEKSDSNEKAIISNEKAITNVAYKTALISTILTGILYYAGNAALAYLPMVVGK